MNNFCYITLLALTFANKEDSSIRLNIRKFGLINTLWQFMLYVLSCAFMHGLAMLLNFLIVIKLALVMVHWFVSGFWPWNVTLEFFFQCLVLSFIYNIFSVIFRKCRKSYHPDCVEKDDSFLDNGTHWTCGKPSHIYRRGYCFFLGLPISFCC